MREIGTVVDVAELAERGRDLTVRSIRRVRGGTFPIGLNRGKGPSYPEGALVTFELSCNRDGSEPCASDVRYITSELEIHTLVYGLLQTDPSVAEAFLLRMIDVERQSLLPESTAVVIKRLYAALYGIDIESSDAASRVVCEIKRYSTVADDAHLMDAASNVRVILLEGCADGVVRQLASMQAEAIDTLLARGPKAVSELVTGRIAYGSPLYGNCSAALQKTVLSETFWTIR